MGLHHIKKFLRKKGNTQQREEELKGTEGDRIFINDTSDKRINI